MNDFTSNHPDATEPQPDSLSRQDEADSEPDSLSRRERAGVRADREPDYPQAVRAALPPELLQRVRELRRNETEAEHLLWQLLRNRNLAGWKFRRQHPFHGYILDFYCHEAHLAIELDGGHHNESRQAAYDTRRSADLECAGLRVLRFWNHEVTEEPASVLQAIIAALEPDPAA